MHGAWERSALANWFNMDNLSPPFQHYSSTLLPSSSSSSSSSSSLSSASLPSSFLPFIPWFENQELSESWSQLVLGGILEEEDRCTFASHQTKIMENWKNQVICQPFMSAHHDTGLISGYPYHFHANDELLHRTPWTTTATTTTSPILSAPSPKSCATSFNSSMLMDFSNSLPEEKKVHKPADHSSECNSILTSNATFKKARTDTSSSSSSSAQSTFKVRKEKLGDRITALHQLVSPFGKTDTASVLLEAIGYIRFLQNQIEALSSPYLVTGSGTMKPSGLHGEVIKKDLRSRGLCLVPISCTLHCGSENGADYWAPTST